jgi:hypothetical protein
MAVLARSSQALEDRYHATGEFVLLAELDPLANEDLGEPVAAAHTAIIFSRLGEDAASRRKRRFRR